MHLKDPYKKKYCEKWENILFEKIRNLYTLTGEIWVFGQRIWCMKIFFFPIFFLSYFIFYHFFNVHIQMEATQHRFRFQLPVFRFQFHLLLNETLEKISFCSFFHLQNKDGSNNFIVVIKIKEQKCIVNWFFIGK